MREYKINNVKRPVYDDISEVPIHIRSKIVNDWQKADIGDWVTADDGAVMEVFRKGSMGRPKGKKRLRYYIGTCTGTYPCVKNAKFSSQRKKNIYSFGGEFAMDLIESRKNLTKKEQIFVQYLIAGISLQKAYMKAFPTNDEGYALVAAKTLTSTERIQTAMRKELEPVMEELGITPQYVLGTMKILADDAEREETRLKALVKLSDVLDLEDKTSTKVTQITGNVFKGFSDEQLKSIERPLEIENGEK
ncbi:MAG: terminase small subunit [Pelagibacterales bacterium]|nr:terminase small subunit [Pelagibacterales bacterium]